MSKKPYRRVLSGLSLAAILCAQTSFAAPPTTQYVPGETTNPNCAPGSANCDVDLSTFQTLSGSTDTDLSGSATGSTLYYNGSQWVDLDLGTQGQVLTSSGGFLIWTTPSAFSNTDEQTLTLSGSEIIISGGNSIDLSGVFTDTNTQLTETQVDSFVSNNGYLTGYTDTDNQTLSFSGNLLVISDGNNVDLSAYLDNTDSQSLTLSGNTLFISGGNSVTLPNFIDTNTQLSDADIGAFGYIKTDTNTQLTEAQVDTFVANNGYLTGELDASTTNEIQSLSLSGNVLTISSGNNVTLPSAGSSTLAGATDTNITSPANGSVLYFDGTNWVDLDLGTQDQVLTSSGGTLVWQTPSTSTGASSRIGEFVFAKSGKSASNGFLAVAAGTVTNGAIDYPLWAAMYPEFVSGNDIVFPADVNGMFLRNLGGNAAAEGIFQDDKTAVNGLTIGYNTEDTETQGYSQNNNNAVWGSDREWVTIGDPLDSSDNETVPRNRAYQLYTIVDTYSDGGSGGGAGSADGNGIVDANTTIGTSRTVGLTDTLNFDSDTLVLDGINNRVGIGTSSPNAKLSLHSNLANSKLMIWDGGNATSGFGFGVQAGDFRIHTNNSSDAIRFYNGVNGTAVSSIDMANGSYTASSDKRLKDNISDTDVTLAKLLDLQVRDYNYIQTPGKKEVGLIAQEAHKVFPELVNVGSNERNEAGNLVKPWTMSYSRLSAYVLQGLQELANFVFGLDAKVAKLEAENAELKTRLEAIEAALAK